MKKLFRICAVIFTAIVLKCAAADGEASQSPAEGVAADIQKHIPAGWTCSFISEKGKMGHPDGLEEPLFRLDFVNVNLTFQFKIKPGQSQPVHPNLRLHFHASADRERILKTIESLGDDNAYPPILFAETKEYLVVFTPIWQNNSSEKIGDTTWGAGVHTDEANKVIAPLMQALKTYFDAKK